MRFKFSNRIQDLPPYLFADIDRKKRELKAAGVEIIDLTVGDPDRPTPGFIIKEMKKWLDNPLTHRYPSYEGTIEFRGAVAQWYKNRFGVDIDPETEVVTLIGSKEGIAHLPLAVINPGDIALVPDPAYPVYNIGVHFAGGKAFIMPLLRENNFLPDFELIQKDLAMNAKLLFLNYPNNPTSATSSPEFFETATKYAMDRKLILCHDAAYSEVFTSKASKPSSILQVEGAKECAIEFHSLSKTFNMTGWRIGFAAGNAEVVQALKRVKTNVDSGVFTAIQMAGITALKGYSRVNKQQQSLFRERRKVMTDGLKKIGIDVFQSYATFYIWARTPDGETSKAFANRLLEAGVAVTPGNGFGRYGEGYFRISLTTDTKNLKEAIYRIKKNL
ncbi:MAG TPA: LL-diaminopimelate aminotransferase [bacterium]